MTIGRSTQPRAAATIPLLRTYSGTDDFVRLAEMYVDTIDIAWAAVPLFWFNAMDGRGPHDLETSIRLHQELMAWYGARGIPVELNEPHHWGMRDAPDVVFVVAAYLSAYNARACGVQDYIAQLMFNSPPGLSDAMDLAKMLACLALIEPLTDETAFRIYRQTRVGLLSHPLDPEAARGHLAASTYLQMALKPHIVHVVGHTEAHHAATADDVIAACKVARRAIEDALAGAPDMRLDPRVQQRAARTGRRGAGHAGCHPPAGRAGRRRSLHRSRHAGARRNLRHPGCPPSAQQPVRARPDRHAHRPARGLRRSGRNERATAA